jgi:hypothetical protein
MDVLTGVASILFERRSATVRTHKQEVCFPGGMVEEVSGFDPSCVCVTPFFLLRLLHNLPRVEWLGSRQYESPLVIYLESSGIELN